MNPPLVLPPIPNYSYKSRLHFKFCIHKQLPVQSGHFERFMIFPAPPSLDGFFFEGRSFFTGISNVALSAFFRFCSAGFRSRASFLSFGRTALFACGFRRCCALASFFSTGTLLLALVRFFGDAFDAFRGLAEDVIGVFFSFRLFFSVMEASQSGSGKIAF